MTELESSDPQNQLPEERKELIRTTLQFALLIRGGNATFQREILRQFDQAEHGLTQDQIVVSAINRLAEEYNAQRTKAIILYEIEDMRLFGILNPPISFTDVSSTDVDTFQLSPYAREYWDSIKNDPNKAASESIFPFVRLAAF